jgi:hypothetical protein
MCCKYQVINKYEENSNVPEFDPVYKDMFQGPEFPTQDEVSRLIQICEIVKKSYVAMSPIDASHEPFKEREKTVS